MNATGFLRLFATDKRSEQSQATQILLAPSLSVPPACRRTAHTLKQLPHPGVPLLAHRDSPETTLLRQHAWAKSCMFKEVKNSNCTAAGCTVMTEDSHTLTRHNIMTLLIWCWSPFAPNTVLTHQTTDSARSLNSLVLVYSNAWGDRRCQSIIHMDAKAEPHQNISTLVIHQARPPSIPRCTNSAHCWCFQQWTQVIVGSLAGLQPHNSIHNLYRFFSSGNNVYQLSQVHIIWCLELNMHFDTSNKRELSFSISWNLAEPKKKY